MTRGGSSSFEAHGGKKSAPVVMSDTLFTQVEKAIKVVHPSSEIAHGFVDNIKKLFDHPIEPSSNRINDVDKRLAEQFTTSYNRKAQLLRQIWSKMTTSSRDVRRFLKTLWMLHDVKQLYEKISNLTVSSINLSSSGGSAFGLGYDVPRALQEIRGGVRQGFERSGRSGRGNRPNSTDSRGRIISFGHPGAYYDDSSFAKLDRSDYENSYSPISNYLTALHEAYTNHTNKQLQSTAIANAKTHFDVCQSTCKKFIEEKSREIGIDENIRPFPDESSRVLAAKFVTNTGASDTLELHEYFVNLLKTHHDSATGGTQKSTINNIKSTYSEFKNATNLQRILTGYDENKELNTWGVFYKKVVKNASFGGVIMKVHHERLSDPTQGKMLIVKDKLMDDLNDSFISQMKSMYDALYGIRVLQDSGTTTTNTSNMTELLNHVITLKDTAEHAAQTISAASKRFLSNEAAGAATPMPEDDAYSVSTSPGSVDLDDDIDHLLDPMRFDNKHDKHKNMKSSGGLPSTFLYRKFDEKAANMYVSELVDFQYRFSKQRLVDDWKTMVEKPASTSLAEIVASQEEIHNVDKEVEDIMKGVLRNTRLVCDSYFETLARFFTTKFRRGFFYMNYWDRKVKSVDTIRYQNIIKDIDETVVKNVKEVREAIRLTTSATSDDLSGSEDLSKWTQIVESVEAMKKGSMYLDRTGEVLTTLRADVKNLLLGKGLPLRMALLRSPLLLMYLTKVARIFFVWAALHFAERVFHMWYVRRVYGQGKTPPKPLGLVGLFIAFEAVMTILLLVVFLAIWRMAGDGPGYFPINASFIKAFLVDYVFSTLCVFAVAAVIATVVQKKKYFRYKYEGERGIRAMSTMIFYVALVLLLVPYFRLTTG